MNKFIPWLFLIPVLALLAGLPSQLHGTLPYHISTASYILSIFGWLFTFCGIFAMSRASRWSQLFFAFVGLVVIVDIGYRLWVGPRSLLHFIFDLVVIWVAIALVRSFPSAKQDDAA
jgi:hypothetical protein